jgi:hypothetical protein
VLTSTLLFYDTCPVENLYTSDFPGDKVKDEHPLVGCQGYVAVI